MAKSIAPELTWNIASRRNSWSCLPIEPAPITGGLFSFIGTFEAGLRADGGHPQAGSEGHGDGTDIDDYDAPKVVHDRCSDHPQYASYSRSALQGLSLFGSSYTEVMSLLTVTH